MLRVLPYILGFDKALDYSLPESLAVSAGSIKRGSIVEVPVRGRSVRGWVLEIDPEPEPGIKPLPVQKLVGIGPSEEVLDLADWACWRWLGRRARFYNLASPPRQVRRLPDALEQKSIPQKNSDFAKSSFTKSSAATKVMRLAPNNRVWPAAKAALEQGPSLILLPDDVRAKKLAQHARRQGFNCAIWPEQWERAAGGGCSVVGTRSAVFATMPDIRSILMIDEHSESYHETWQSVTWHAREVARERAKRLGVPFTMTSPVPTLEAQNDAELICQLRTEEQNGWPALVIADLREREHAGLFSYQLTDELQRASRAVCIVKRAGVSEARQQLARLLREPVGKITARETDNENARVLIGTTVALRRVDRCDLVAFLEFDMILASPHYRAEETALALLAEAARLAGPRAGGGRLPVQTPQPEHHPRYQPGEIPPPGRLLVQTRQPEHPVLRSVAEADPAIFSEHDSQLRRDLRLPPFAAVAKATGDEVDRFVKALQTAHPPDIDVMGPDQEGAWLLRAPDHSTLCDFLASVSEIPDSIRISIDPPRL